MITDIEKRQKPNDSDWLSKTSKWAGIVSGCIAVISLIANIVAPTNPVIVTVKNTFPSYFIFLVLATVVLLGYFLFNNLVVRIGNINFGNQGTVINESNIGNYISENIQSIDKDQLNKIIDKVAEQAKTSSETAERMLDKSFDAFAKKDRSRLAERIMEKISDDAILGDVLKKLVEDS